MRPISRSTALKPSYCRLDDATLYVSLELSQATWLVTSLSPGSEKMSKHSTPGGDGAALLGLLRRLQVRAEQVTGGPVGIVVIQEAGLDGFWVHRLLEANGWVIDRRTSGMAISAFQLWQQASTIAV
jgi:transposase